MSRTAIAANTKKPATAEHKVAVERPHKNLTQTQEEIADVASEIILNGGKREDVEPILMALLRHQYKNRSFARGRYAATPNEVDNKADEFATNNVDYWYQHLAKRWPEQKSGKDDEQTQPLAKTVTEMVRANIRESLRCHFDQFLTDTRGIEPIWLLNEILENFNGDQDMGESIYYPMDRAEIYVRVPWEHRQRIEDFVAFLEKEEAA